MKGHVYKRAKDSWTIVVDLPRDVDARRKQKSVTVRGTKKEAERELAKLLNEINTGGYIEPSRMTVGEYLEHWLEDYAKVSVSAKTYSRYQEIVCKNLIPALGRYQLSKLQPLQIQSYYSEALKSGRKDRKEGGLSPQTVLHYHRVLREALQQAIKWQLIVRNPADAVEPPRPVRPEMKILNEEEIARIIEASHGTRFYTPILLALTTGLRRGEILGLKWQDVDLDAGTISVRRSLEQTKSKIAFKEPKTSKSRRLISLPYVLVEALKRHREEQELQRLVLGPAYDDNDLVCAQADGKLVPPSSVSTYFCDILTKAKLPQIRFHDLRHTHATILLREGVHPKVVSERLGHSTIGITLDTYSHVLPGMQEEAARKLDATFRVAMSGNKTSKEAA